MSDVDLKTPLIDVPGFSFKAAHALHQQNICTLGDLKKKTMMDLLKIKNMGRVSVNHTIKLLKEMGIEIAQPKAAVNKTWLDYCAFKAMQGMMSNPVSSSIPLKKMVEVSYDIATAMLAEKRKREGNE